MFEFLATLAVVAGIIATASIGAGLATRPTRLRPRPPRSPLERSWREAAEACSLTSLEEGSFPDSLTARASPLRVRFEPRFEHPQGTRLLIDSLENDMVALSLQREGLGTAEQKSRGAREIETGDSGFDAEFFVTGPVTAIRAALDLDARRLLRLLSSAVDLEVRNGVLRAHVVKTGDPGGHGQALARWIPSLLDAARHLRRSPHVVARLAHNATRDLEPRVRLENLFSLLREYPHHVPTRTALEAAQHDSSDEIRVVAATALGAQGRATLMELAERADVEDGCAARAIAALGSHLPFEGASGILGRALRARHVDTARACLATIAHSGDAALETLAKVLKVEAGSLAVAAAQGLAETGLVAAEGPLIDALDREDMEVRVAAAEALGLLGTARAVLPLKEAEARHAAERPFARAARQAIAAIQSRLTAASPGQLSIADATKVGALSLAQNEEGRLSLDDHSES